MIKQRNGEHKEAAWKRVDSLLLFIQFSNATKTWQLLTGMTMTLAADDVSGPRVLSHKRTHKIAFGITYKSSSILHFYLVVIIYSDSTRDHLIPPKTMSTTQGFPFRIVFHVQIRSTDCSSSPLFFQILFPLLIRWIPYWRCVALSSLLPAGVRWLRCVSWQNLVERYLARNIEFDEYAFCIRFMFIANALPLPMFATSHSSYVVWCVEREKWPTYHSISVISVSGHCPAMACERQLSCADIQNDFHLFCV